MTRLALAFSAGAAWVFAGAPIELAPLAGAVWLLAPIRASVGPGAKSVWAMVAAVGLGAAWLAQPGPACVAPADGTPGTLEGRFLASPRGGSAPFERVDGCGAITAVSSDSLARAGEPVVLSGTWRMGSGERPWFLAERAEVAADERTPVKPRWGTVRWGTVRWRDQLVRRFERLYGDHAPLVAALVLARTEGLDRELREAYARAGIAHMLAISGYHVGVIAGLVLGGLRAWGWSLSRAALGAAAVSNVYVAFIGFPDAALRAALMVTLAAIARARTTPPAKWGTLGAALLMLVALDPSRVASAGVQLSFAGVAGLVAWCGPLCRILQGWCHRFFAWRCPQEVAMPFAAGLAATVATLPVVAWHFERVSLVGVPATILATPLVAWALAGSIASLALDFVWPPLAEFLAGGVGVTLTVLDAGATAAAAWPWASVWTTRTSVTVALLVLGSAWLLAWHPRVGGRARRGIAVLYATAAVVAWPLLVTWQGRGTVEVLMIDVGQGDAVAIRSPRGSWFLVDAGPPAGDDSGAHPVVRALASRGVRRLEAVVLTHPHLDHLGGAAAVLRSFEVGVVYDPGLPAPSPEYLDLLELAAERHVPWRAARAGDRFAIGDLDAEVLHPLAGAVPLQDANQTSVILHLAYGDFNALLTGDAYREEERLLADRLPPDLEVLKVGHHGSGTSTDSLLLARTRPDLALVSLGRRNRYGHPSAEVVSLLRRHGVEIWRTDEHGTVRVLGRPDGSYTVSGERRR